MRFITLLPLGAALLFVEISECKLDASCVKNLVSFGDSYTDEGRLAAYGANQGKAPPPGTNTSGSIMTAIGGHPWGHWATTQLGASYYDYAVSGAFCSNKIFERQLASINRTFPSVLEDQIPSFLTDLSYVNQSTGVKYLGGLTPDNTVYALWVGTNDLGIDAFLTESQHAGLTLTDFTDCIFTVFDQIYKAGGRNFVLLNQAPLELSPLYAAPQNHGVANSQYWMNKTAYNTTEYEVKIRQYSTSVNTLFRYGLPFEHLVQKRWKGAELSILDVNSLMRDIYEHPATYLDSPANATGFFHQCNATGKACVDAKEPASSFLWYDELHPSEKTSSIIGSEFVKVLKGTSKYGICY